MRYTVQNRQRRWPKRLLIVAVCGIVLLLTATLLAWRAYESNLRPVSGNVTQTRRVTIKPGSSTDVIAKQLQAAGLIRSAWAFNLYVSSKEVRDELQAGTYDLEPSQSTPEIIAQLSHGKIATDLVTILPSRRIDEIRRTLINDGFSTASVDEALNPDNYAHNAALVDKPANASLEGYLYPDSFQKTSTTTASDIVSQSLQEMQEHLTPDIRAAFTAHGLTTYQGLTLASIVEQEVSRQSDRSQAAQVFVKRLGSNMPLGSDVTAFYGATLAGQKPSTSYDSPYNTLLHTGLPPTPISNVSAGALQAAAHPASTSWLYFVTGDDGTTHFSQTLQQHEAFTAQYCHKLCGQD